MKNLKPVRLGKENSSKSKRAKNIFKKLTLLLVVVGVLMSFALFLITRSGTSSYSSYVNYIFSGTTLKSTDDRVNVLLLGIPGGTHDGPNLTDTIMIASYNLKTDQINLISIPRDLWLPSLQSKANAVYQISLSQNSGLGLPKTVMGNILGLTIHYALRIDFNGFIQAVDILDGLDVEVDRTFDDYNYPIAGKENDLCGYTEQEIDFSEEQAKQLSIEPGKRKVFVAPDGSIATDSAKEDIGAKYFTCRYEHLRFNKGVLQLDGETALKFVRSRHGTNGEGTDFARSKRQEKVLKAIKGKVLSFETLTSPVKISELFQTFDRSIDTDIAVKDIPEFYKLFSKADKMQTFVLDDSKRSGLPDNRASLLVNPPRGDYGGAYVLVSLDDDFSTIQEYVKKILEGVITEYEATAAARPR